MSHHCHAHVLACIDFRLHRQLAEWADKRFGPNNYDLCLMAGAARALLDPTTQAAALKQIDISVELHQIKEIAVINHEDCGAYGRENFADTAAETARHQSDLAEAGRLLRQRHPELTVSTWYQRLDGSVAAL